MNEELIQKNLKSINIKVQESVFRFLEKSGNLSHLKLILDKVSDIEDKFVRKVAVEAAASIIRRSLLNNFSDLNSKMRQSLAKIMKTLHPTIVDHIAQDLQNRDSDKRFNAIRVLGLMGKNPKVKELLKKLINDRNEMVRATAISLLKEMMSNTDVQLIANLLNDKDNRVVANCIECVESLNHERLSPLLLRFKSHPNNRIRGNALKALWTLNFCDVFPDVKAMCHDKNDFLMRATGCWIVGECARTSDHDFLDLLAGLISDEEKLVRQNVIKAQLKIGGEINQKILAQLADPEEIKEAQKDMDR